MWDSWSLLWKIKESESWYNVQLKKKNQTNKKHFWIIIQNYSLKQNHLGTNAKKNPTDTLFNLHAPSNFLLMSDNSFKLIRLIVKKYRCTFSLYRGRTICRENPFFFVVCVCAEQQWANKVKYKPWASFSIKAGAKAKVFSQLWHTLGSLYIIKLAQRGFLMKCSLHCKLSTVNISC